MTWTLEIDSKNRQKIKDVIKSLKAEARAGTDLRQPLEEVLQRAKEFLEKHAASDVGARIIIFSDGYVDAAASEFQQIISNYDTDKIQVNCMGIGPEHGPSEEPDPLPEIAKYGQGEYKRFDNLNQKIPVFTFDTAPWKKSPKITARCGRGPNLCFLVFLLW